MKHSPLAYAAATGVLLVSASLSAFLLSLQSATAQLPRIAVETRGALLRALAAEGDKTRSTAAQLLGETRTELLALTDTQLTGTRSDVLSRVDALSRDANARTGEALAMVRENATGIRADLRPVLVNATALTANSAALVKDAQDSLDDSYWDGKALIESATVATTSFAQASEAARDAAPKVAASVVSIGQSSAGIAADVQREADELTKPQTRRQKIFAWLGLIPRIARIVF